MKVIMYIALGLIFSFKAFAGPVPFKVIQDFHDKRIDTLVENYGLNGKVDATVLISPLEVKTLNQEAKQQRVRLPGLLLGGLEVENSESNMGIYEILEASKDYKRDITLVKRKKINDDEVEALTSSLREYLQLRDEETVKIEDKVFNMAEAMKNWRSDLLQSMYTSFFKADYWAWIPLSLFVLFMLSLFLAGSLKQAFQGLGSSIEKASDAGGVSAAEASRLEAMSSDEDEFSDLVETEVDQVFELDLDSVLDKVIQLHATSKFELFNILWTYLPSAEKQISFYEAITSAVELERAELFKSIFFESFKLDLNKLTNLKTGDFVTAHELAKMHKSLLCAQLVDASPMREKALSAVFPKYGVALNSVVEQSVEKFFSVVYYLFPEVVADLLKNKPQVSKKISAKIAAHLTKSESQRLPTDIDVKAFTKFLNENESRILNGDVSLHLDENITKILYSMPDSSIFELESWSPEHKSHLMRVIPNVNWITAENSSVLKIFFLNLSELEMHYVSQEHKDYEFLFAALDERGQMRVAEKVKRGAEALEKGEGTMSIPKFRGKIKGVFKPLAKEQTQVVEVVPDAA